LADRAVLVDSTDGVARRTVKNVFEYRG
jgi:hypothetical protein